MFIIFSSAVTNLLFSPSSAIFFFLWSSSLEDLFRSFLKKIFHVSAYVSFTFSYIWNIVVITISTNSISCIVSGSVLIDCSPCASMLFSPSSAWPRPPHPKQHLLRKAFPDEELGQPPPLSCDLLLPCASP